jgi:hypothetical protein
MAAEMGNRLAWNAFRGLPNAPRSLSGGVPVTQIFNYRDNECQFLMT